MNSRQVGPGTKQKSGDVLSEIDNMLQGLTDELDAMLEFDLAEWDETDEMIQDLIDKHYVSWD